MALVVLSVVEQRLDAVRAVLAGMDVTEVAVRVGVHRSTVHRWVARYLSEQLGGLADRSHRPKCSPNQVSEQVEVAIAEIRREHPRWGSRRIWLELSKAPPPWQSEQVPVPSQRTIDRILIRQGLARARPRKKPKQAWQRFERPGPMQLWGIDIVGGIELVDPVTGVVREAKIVTGVDDHSRYCVLAQVVERATSRAVCLAFAEALARFGVPEEVITDNGKQFTDRFNALGRVRVEVLFDRICRHNGIRHRLTAPASPNQNGKVERFHRTFRPEIEQAGPFPSLAEAQAAVDDWVRGYNEQRPHQGLDATSPVMPADRFAPATGDAVGLWLPPTLAILTASPDTASPDTAPAQTHPTTDTEAAGKPTTATAPAGALPAQARTPGSGEPVQIERIVPASGNLGLLRQQFWLGTHRAGQTVRLWIDCDWVHLTVADQRIKTVPSRFTVTDLDTLTAQGGVPAGPAPGSTRERDGSKIVEVTRVVNRAGSIQLGTHTVVAAYVLAGRRVGVWIEDDAPLLFFDPDTRELLRTRENPLTPTQARRLQRQATPGIRPRPSLEPVTVQRRAWATGCILIAGQKIALGRQHAGQMVTVHVSETTLAIELPDGDTRVLPRTTDQPVRNIKGQRPRTAPVF